MRNSKQSWHEAGTEVAPDDKKNETDSFIQTRGGDTRDPGCSVILVSVWEASMSEVT